MPESKKNVFFEWIKVAVLALVLFYFIHMFLFSNYEVEGTSMQSTLKDGDKLIVNKIGYEFGEISRFDVIVFHSDYKEDYVKRVIGLPGDRIQYKNDHLYINGKRYEEPYLHNEDQLVLGQKETGDFSLKELTGENKVPSGSLFVMGDNRLNSYDSRHFGFISINQVVGKVNVRYWPLERFDVSF